MTKLRVQRRADAQPTFGFLARRTSHPDEVCIGAEAPPVSHHPCDLLMEVNAHRWCVIT
jgi:hypothetical protein